MVRRDLGADGNQPIVGNTELGELQFRLDIGDREAAALRLGHILHLRRPDTELHGDVAVFLRGAMRDDLTAVDFKHGDRHMLARVREDAGHTDLLCDDA